jgi:hypoxanthine phosphoribosyltransferase
MSNILFTEQQIQDAIKEMARRINDLNLESAVFVCVLNGGFMFYSDLIKHITIPDVECDFIRVKSYKGQEKGEIMMVKGMELSVENKNVFLIDDIYDSGETVAYITRFLEKHKPKKILPVTLLKRRSSETLPALNWCLEIENEWIYGYGLDGDNGYYRNLPFILVK